MRKKLFTSLRIYNHPATDDLFLHAMKEHIAHHRKHNAYYEKLLSQQRFSLSDLTSINALSAIPPIPAAFFKRHETWSLPMEQMAINATSSGTKGQKSQLLLDKESLALGKQMVIRTFVRHGLVSPIPTDYVMLIPPPSEKSTQGAVQTAMGVTCFAPKLSAVFALRPDGDGFAPNDLGVMEAIVESTKKSGWPVRFIGFPALLFALLQKMEQQNIALTLHSSSRIILGGGWKQFAGLEISKEKLYKMAEERLGIPAYHCHDFYSAVEHPIAYVQCECQRFHVPVWSRVIIRDPKTLAPLPYGQVGLFNPITPLVYSSPLGSVLMGDMAIAHAPGSCPCRNPAPSFEIVGRAGDGSLRNCAVAASEWLMEASI